MRGTLHCGTTVLPINWQYSTIVLPIDWQYSTPINVTLIDSSVLKHSTVRYSMVQYQVSINWWPLSPPTPMCNDKQRIVLTFADPEKWWRYVETQGTVNRSPVSCWSARLQADGQRQEYLAYKFETQGMPTFDATCGVLTMCKIVDGDESDSTYMVTCLLVGHVREIKKNYVS